MKIKVFRNIDFNAWHSSVALPKVLEIKTAISQTIEGACGNRFKGLNFAVTCAFVCATKIQQYNLEYRGQNKATDVLSFPEYDFDTQTWGEVFVPPSNRSETKTFYLGDVLLSYQNVIEDARQMGWRPSSRVIHLVVHSVLHLLGFDHIEEDDRLVMEGLEIKILGALGLPNPFVIQGAQHEEGQKRKAQST